MKKGVFFILFFIFIYGCGTEEEHTEGGIKNSDIIVLSEEQISNFVNVLPSILEFSEKYNETLSKQEKESPDANKKFFETLKKSKKIQRLAKENHFSSIDELIVVYKNVVLSYMSIKLEFTNFNENISHIQSLIESNELKLSNEVKENKITKKDFEEKLEEIKIDKIRVQNIITTKKYEKQIDEISKRYN
ncbi:MAG: hypothetical protein N2258_02490 [Brevinematales bacterium]|nr:hypothetical protein [Brevinematales bacterium]